MNEQMDGRQAVAWIEDRLRRGISIANGIDERLAEIRAELEAAEKAWDIVGRVAKIAPHPDFDHYPLAEKARRILAEKQASARPDGGDRKDGQDAG